MFQQDQALNYATQVQNRLRVINSAISTMMHNERRMVSRDVSKERLVSCVYEKIEILSNFILMGNYTQKRVNVIEQYLQELEVLLNLDQ